MKLFACDFDNTLYRWEKEDRLSHYDTEAIAEFRRSGGLFGVCTGRSLKGITVPCEGIVDFDFYILASGALILDGSFNVIYKSCADRELIKEIFRKYGSEDLSIIHANDTVYSFNDFYELQTQISSFDEIEGDSFYGISIALDSRDDVLKLCDRINREYSGLVCAFANAHIADIVSEGCSKGEALAKVKGYFEADYIASMGDSYNDVPMFKYSDAAFTFPSSVDEVRNEADFLVESVGDAVYKVLEAEI